MSHKTDLEFTVSETTAFLKLTLLKISPILSNGGRKGAKITQANFFSLKFSFKVMHIFKRILTSPTLNAEAIPLEVATVTLF